MKLLNFPSFLLILLIVSFSCSDQKNNPSLIFDFDFASLAIEYFETGDTTLLQKIAETGGAKHIYSHAKQFSREDFDYGLPLDSKYAMIEALLSPFDQKKEFLPVYKRALQYAKDSIEKAGIISREVLKYLPSDFKFRDSTTLFFTIGYDLGVTFDGNSSVNLAHPHYRKNLKEIKFYSVHEMHHAGFLQVKNRPLPSIDLKDRGQARSIVEYFTHLEGMATYAAYNIRKMGEGLDSDQDYIVLRNDSLMEKLEEEFFDIYEHFSKKPEAIVTEEDWKLISELSNKRLWYRVGAKIAHDIDSVYGRDYLVNLIRKDPGIFIEEYISLKEF